MYKYLRYPALAVLCLLTALQPEAAADTYYQDFDSWSGPPAIPWFANKSSTNSDKWVVINGFATNIYPAGDSAPWGVWLALNGSHIISAPLTNGAGIIELSRYKFGVNDCFFTVDVTTNSGSTWTTLATFTNLSASWEATNINYNSYSTGSMVRLYKSNFAAGTLAGFDNIDIHYPLPYVVITNIALNPDPPLSETITVVSADILPKSFASNIQATLYYSTNNGASYGQVSMSYTGGTGYSTAPSGIPGVDNPGSTLRYYISTTFDGDRITDVPQTEPASAPASVFTAMTRARPFLFNSTNITVSGPPSTNMYMQSDYTWRGVTPSGSYPNPSFRFQAGATSWGDTNQSASVPPFDSVAELSASSNILLTGTITNKLLFIFNDNPTNLEYSIQLCQYNDFDTWTGASSFSSYTNADKWVMLNGRTTTGIETNRAFNNRGFAGVLRGSSNGSLVTPLMNTGLGSISFRYRNWLDDGSTATTFRVEKSVDGLGGWSVVASNNAVLSRDYVFYSLNVADNQNFYLRIINTTPDINQLLLIEDVAVTPPGALVVFSNHIRNPVPEGPEALPLSIDYAVSGGATDLVCKLYWLSPDAPEYDWSYMSETSGTYYGSVPPTIPGEVRYYIECTYDGFAAAPARYPVSGYQVYTNTSTPNGPRSQNFDTWSGPKATFNYSVDNSGWVSSNNLITNNAIFAAKTGWACWALFDTTAEIRSPVITNGIAGIFYSAKNYSSAGDTNTKYTIEVSTNAGAAWTTVDSGAITNTSWTDFGLEYTLYDDCMVRFKRGNFINGRFIGYEDIVLPPPPADAVITNVWIDPGYPGTADTVTVYCDVSPHNENIKSFNYQPKICFKPKYGVWTTNSMTRRDDETYAGTIPPQGPDTVEYFIRVDFSGYYYTNGTVTTKRSPAFLPDAPASQDKPDSYFEYIPRRFLSEFDSLAVTSNVGNVEMALVDDYIWQGIFKDVSSTQMLVNFSGLGYFTGSGYSSATSIWGDADQVLFSTPLTGNSTQYGPAVTININTQSRSQVMFRLNSRTGQYEVRRCAYEDFDSWNALPDYFYHSLNLADMLEYTNTFNAWTTNNIYVTPTNGGFEDFQSWPYTNYTFDPTHSLSVNSSNGYYIDDFSIVGEIGRYDTPNRACDFYPGLNQGSVWPHAATLPDGLGEITWKVRCRYEDGYQTWYTNGLNWTNYSVSATIYANDIAGWPTLSILAHYQNASNYYLCQVRGTNYNGASTAQYNFGLFKVINGVKTHLTSQNRSGSISNAMTVTLRISPNATLTRLHASSTVGSGDIAYHDAVSGLATGGSIGFLSDDAAMYVDNIAVSNYSLLVFDGWNTGGWVDALTNNHWKFNYFWPISNFLSLSNRTDASIVTPYQSKPPARLSFQYHNWGTPTVSCIVEGSDDGVSWPFVIANITDVTNSQWRTANITSGISSRKYLRVRNSQGVGTLLIDNIVVESTPSSPNLVYEEDFSDGLAQNWRDDSGYWNVAPGQIYTRQAYTGPTLGFKLESQYDTNTSTYPTGPWTAVTNYSISNNQWQAYSQTFRFWDRLFTRISHTTGLVASLRVDDIKMTGWTGTNYLDEDGWRTTQGWTATTNPGNNHIELWRSRANPSSNQTVRSLLMSNGVGIVRFDYKFDQVSDLSNGTFKIQCATEVAPESFFTTNAYSVGTDTWQVCAMPINVATSMYIRVLHDSPSTNTVLTIDNFRITDYRARDERTWEAYNVLITDNQDTREFEPFYQPATDVQTAFLNNHPSNNVYPGAFYSNSIPFIQSGRVGEGIGRVSFWYRSWQTNGAPAGRIQLYASNSDTNAMTNWALIDEIPVVNNTEYRLYENDFYIRTNSYLRVACLTNGSYTRVCIDNMLVAEPLAADLDIQSIILTPAVPLYTNSVRFGAQLGRYVLNPSNIQARLYYHVGTDDWANAGQTWDTNDYIELNDLVWDSGISMYLQSTDSVPQQNIDTVVQYYVECTFDGVFSEYSSPKKGRVFTNPSWYSNVNLNVGKAITNPYYIVYSCPPDHVWINEFNYYYNLSPDTNEFVEIAGRSGSIVSNWSVQLLKPDLTLYGNYSITNIYALPNDSGGFGFWVLGDSQMSAASDLIFTNTADGSKHMAAVGGIRLVRSSGIWEDAVSYGSGGGSMTGFTYTTMKSAAFNDSPIRLTGTGDTATAFIWNYDTTKKSTQGAVNWNQDLQLTLNGYTIIISNFWTTSSNTWVVFTTDAPTQIDPKAWYTTNLINTNWTMLTAGTGFIYSAASGTYTQWFDNVTNPAPVYFRISSTNEF